MLERHGGTVEKYIGDAVMAVFGTQAARGRRAPSDPGRRRHGAALTSLNDELERTVGVALATRTGVSTGEVFVSHVAEGPPIVGNAVNVAARLQQAAAPGDILITRDTYQLVRGSVEVDEASSLVLKGKRMPVTAYRVASIAGVREAPRRAEPGLVGRDEQLRLLGAALDGVVADRTCRLVSVFGGAGAGKSRLATEFVAGVEDRAVALTGRCLPYGEGITFWPVAEAVRQLAGIEVDDPLTVARSKLGSVLGGAEESRLLFERVAAATGLSDATVGMQETFWALRKPLEHVARQRPLIVIFDDLQWAESAFLDLLEVLVRSCRDAPILILCLARSDLVEDRAEWAARVPGATMMHLPPLTTKSPRIDRGTPPGEDLVGGLKERITEVGSGNPLFIVEMFQMLRDDGLVGIAPADVADGTEGDVSTIPPTIQALVGARLDRLGDEERAILHGAAVIGKVFSRAQWSNSSLGASATPQSAPAGPPPTRADRAGQLGARRRGRFAFRHLLIQEAAYRETPKEERADLHPASPGGWRRHPAIGSERTRRSSPITSSRPRSTSSSSAGGTTRREDPSIVRARPSPPWVDVRSHGVTYRRPRTSSVARTTSWRTTTRSGTRWHPSSDW